MSHNFPTFRSFLLLTLLTASTSILIAPGLAVGQTGEEALSANRPPGLLLASADAEARVIAARRDMMAFRLDAARTSFEALLEAPGNDEAALYHLTGLDFLDAMFEQTDPYFDRFSDRSEAFEEALEKADESAWRTFMEAENYLMRAFVHGRKGDFLRTAVSAREAYVKYLETLRADPTLLDAETGIGLLKALIGATPPAYRRFLKMLGYSGTVEEGIQLLDHAANGARYNAPLAAIIADVTRIYMNRGRAVGIRHVADQWETDKNPASGLLYTFALRYDQKPEEAAAVALEALQIGEEPAYRQVAFLYFHRGSALFSMNRFEEAAEDLATYVHIFKGQSFRATAQVRLGMALEMLGRRDEAVEVYRAVSAPTEFDIDLAAQRDAKNLLRNPMSEIRKTLVRGHNAVNGGRSDEAMQLLEPVYYGPDVANVERTEAAYWLGRAYHGAGDLDEAATKYVYVRTHPIDDDERWAPWATYYLGKIRAARGQKEEAKDLFEEAIDFGGDYDFKKSLRRNARLALDRL